MDVRRSAETPPADVASWWTHFDDPVLTQLIEHALAQNLTLRQAGLRVLRARALRGVAVGEIFPQTQIATGEVGNNRLSANSPEGQGDRAFSNYGLGLQAAWELDFWGRFRRAIESAAASLDASLADYDAALVLLTADVGSVYVAIRSLEEQLGFTRANVEAQQETLDLTKVRFEVGAVSELDVATAEAALANTRALVPRIEDSLQASTLALCVLLGRTPSTLSDELGPSGAVPSAPAEIALGVPADLLRRRPDVRSAERTVAALSAELGVATADLYPAFAIKGLTGFRATTAELATRSPSPHNLFDSSSFIGFIGLDMTWPILDYGRIRNNIRAADARLEEARTAYRNTVLQAAADVETGLSSFLRSRERAALLAESVTAAQRTVELSLIRYRQGASDFLRVSQAQVDLVERQNSLVIARSDVARGAIETFRALGGGWESASARELVPRATADEMRARTDWGDLLDSVEAPKSTAPAEDEATHGREN